MFDRFVQGDIVTDGVRTGTVGDGFYYKDSDDGTENQPDSSGNVIPISWDDGTRGYRHVSTLVYA